MTLWVQMPHKYPRLKFVVKNIAWSLLSVIEEGSFIHYIHLWLRRLTKLVYNTHLFKYILNRKDDIDHLSSNHLVLCSFPCYFCLHPLHTRFFRHATCSLFIHVFFVFFLFHLIFTNKPLSLFPRLTAESLILSPSSILMPEMQCFDRHFCLNNKLTHCCQSSCNHLCFQTSPLSIIKHTVTMISSEEIRKYCI